MTGGIYTMDRAFTQELMEKTGFPAEARQAFTQAEEIGRAHV